MTSENGIPTTVDVVVVGSGSAGAVVARRLVDAGVRVCVIEAGGPDENPAIHDPGRAVGALGQPRRLGIQDCPAGRLPRPAAQLPARQGARRDQLPERDDLHPRQSPRLRRLGRGRLHRVGVRGRPAALQAFRGFQPRRVRVPRRGRPASRQRRLRAAPAHSRDRRGGAGGRRPLHRRSQRRQPGRCRLRPPDDQGERPPEPGGRVPATGDGCAEPDAADRDACPAAPDRRRPLRRRRDRRRLGSAPSTRSSSVPARSTRPSC